MLDQKTAAAVRDAVKRVLQGRETVPPDLPYSTAIWAYVVEAMWPGAHPDRMSFTPEGRRLSRATMRVYLAGYFAGRAGDAQIGRQVRDALGLGEGAASTPHGYVGLAVCLVCDQGSDADMHQPPRLCAHCTRRVVSVDGRLRHVDGMTAACANGRTSATEGG